MLLYFNDEQAYAARLATAAGLTLGAIERHCFPDGEVKLRLPVPLPPGVVVLRSLHDPNEKLVELLLAARTARELGARHLTLVAPYLAYMRQDMAFAPGESVSQRIVGHWIAELFDAVVTIDPHLHRVASLRDAVPARSAVALSAAALIGTAFRTANVLMLGPDEESENWVRVAAQACGCEAAVCRKQRRGDRDVDLVLPDVALGGRHVVIIDDVASTGHTLAAAARAVLAARARCVDAAVTHALMSDDAGQVLKAAGVGQLISTDTVPHASNRIGTTALVADALRALPG
jgi:ribose-phosphate pyrophosphokinase